MKRLFILFILFALPVSAQESGYERISDFSKESNVILNDQLRRTSRRLRDIEAGIDLTTDVTGILPLLNGGTASALVDPNADRILFWDDSEGTVDFLTIGSGLTITGTTITSDLLSNVIFSWSGVDNASGTTRGIHIGSSQNPGLNPQVDFMFLYSQGNSAVTLLNFQFTKIAGISTITIHGRLWTGTTTGTEEAILTVDIGGQANTVKSVTSTTPTWVTTSDIDVSGLSDGTVYDGIIQLHNETNAKATYCSAVTLIAS